MNKIEEKLLWTFESASHEETQALGEKLGRACQGGEVILLEGDLGAGKTCLSGGLARGLNIAEPAVSPTFVILRSYQGKAKDTKSASAKPESGKPGLWLHHFDFYRFTSEADLDTVGYEDCLAENAVVLIEWPERCPSVFADASMLLKLTVTGEASRRIAAHAGPKPLGKKLAQLKP